MTDTFIPPMPPKSGPSGNVRFNVTELRFGEGYVSSMGEGMNNRRQSWPMTWEGTDAEIEIIADFFDAHEGYKKFFWTPPMGVQGLYIVKEYSLIPEAAGNATINALLEQRFAP